MKPREYRRRLQALADRYGYEIVHTRGNHLRLVKPGRPFVSAACSSSDHRALKNIEGYIRRHERNAS